MKRRSFIAGTIVAPLLSFIGLKPGKSAPVSQPPASPADVNQGHTFHCKNGHPCCEAIDDIRYGEGFFVEKIGNWHYGTKEPALGDPWPRCGQCGEPVVFWVRDGVINGF